MLFISGKRKQEKCLDGIEIEIYWEEEDDMKKEKEVKKVIAIKTEVYSRVVGYYRPISNWNKGKKEEFRQRKNLKIGGKDV